MSAEKLSTGYEEAMLNSESRPGVVAGAGHFALVAEGDYESPMGPINTEDASKVTMGGGNNDADNYDEKR